MKCADCRLKFLCFSHNLHNYNLFILKLSSLIWKYNIYTLPKDLKLIQNSLVISLVHQMNQYLKILTVFKFKNV